MIQTFNGFSHVVHVYLFILTYSPHDKFYFPFFYLFIFFLHNSFILIIHMYGMRLQFLHVLFIRDNILFAESYDKFMITCVMHVIFP